MGAYTVVVSDRPPVRIQRRRSSGWQMPPNTVYVGRPSPWGNVHRVTRTDDRAERAAAVSAFARYCREHPEFRERIREELRGKNLACWCALDQSCHADVLLGIANP